MSISKLNEAMLYLASKPNTLFVGQAVCYPGQAAFKSFDGIPMERRIEMPVAEDMQMGICIGLALEGFVPISFYPRWDFLLLAANQLVNHLDKAPLFGWKPKVIIRTAIGHTSPMDAGPQHTQNHTGPFRWMLDSVEVIEIHDPNKIMDAYHYAWDAEKSVIVVEHMSYYR